MYGYLSKDGKKIFDVTSIAVKVDSANFPTTTSKWRTIDGKYDVEVSRDGKPYRAKVGSTLEISMKDGGTHTVVATKEAE